MSRCLTESRCPDVQIWSSETVPNVRIILLLFTPLEFFISALDAVQMSRIQIWIPDDNRCGVCNAGHLIRLLVPNSSCPLSPRPFGDCSKCPVNNNNRTFGTVSKRPRKKRTGRVRNQKTNQMTGIADTTLLLLFTS